MLHRSYAKKPLNLNHLIKKKYGHFSKEKKKKYANKLEMKEVMRIKPLLLFLVHLKVSYTITQPHLLVESTSRKKEKKK